MLIKDLDHKVNNLQIRLTTLLKEYKSLKEKLADSDREKKELQSRLEQREQELINFQNQDKISKIVSSIADETHGHTELKLKVNELIREIDKCIAHLSE